MLETEMSALLHGDDYRYRHFSGLFSYPARDVRLIRDDFIIMHIFRCHYYAFRR